MNIHENCITNNCIFSIYLYQETVGQSVFCVLLVTKNWKWGTTRLWNFIFIEGDWLYCMLSKKHDMKNPRNKSTVFSQESSKRYRKGTLTLGYVVNRMSWLTDSLWSTSFWNADTLFKTSDDFASWWFLHFKWSVNVPFRYRYILKIYNYSLCSSRGCSSFSAEERKRQSNLKEKMWSCMIEWQ
jgi:hypothetical protein